MAKKGELGQFAVWFKEQYPTWSNAIKAQDLHDLQQIVNAGKAAKMELEYSRMALIAYNAAMCGFMAGYDAGRRSNAKSNT